MLRRSCPHERSTLNVALAHPGGAPAVGLPATALHSRDLLTRGAAQVDKILKRYPSNYKQVRCVLQRVFAALLLLTRPRLSSPLSSRCWTWRSSSMADGCRLRP